MPNTPVPASAIALPTPRRGFLRALATLPLIGGGVTLIGAPTAVAGEPSREAVEAYAMWLHQEARAVQQHLHPEGTRLNGKRAVYIPFDNEVMDFFFPVGSARRDWSLVGQEAARRAPLVLSTVGCGWREGGR